MALVEDQRAGVVGAMSPDHKTWDQASDDEIVEEIRAMCRTGFRFVSFGPAVERLLRERGLWDRVSDLLQDAGKVVN